MNQSSSGESSRNIAVDRAHLDQLSSRFGAAFLIQLIDLFISQGRERISVAQQAAAAGDGRTVSGAAHALKSSAGNLGAAPLGSRAAEVERASAGELRSVALVSLVADLQKDFEAACAALRSVRSAYGETSGGAS